LTRLMLARQIVYLLGMKRSIATVIWGFLVAGLAGYAMFALGWVIAEPSSAPMSLGSFGFIMTLAFLLYKAGRDFLP
jgi:CHASE2 domain-containing sensor protein